MKRPSREELWVSLRKGTSSALHVGWEKGGWANNLTARNTEAKISNSGRVELSLDLSHNLRSRSSDDLKYDAEDVEDNKDRLQRIEVHDHGAIENLGKVLTARDVQPTEWVVHLRVRSTLSYECTMEYRDPDIVFHVSDQLANA